MSPAKCHMLCASHWRHTIPASLWRHLQENRMPGRCRGTSSVHWRLAIGTIPAAGRRLRAAMHFSVYSQRDHIGMQANMQLATHTRRNTDTNTAANKCTGPNTQAHTFKHTDTHRHTQTHTDTHRDEHTHTQPQTHTHTSMSKHPIIRFFAHHRPFCLKLRSSTAIA
jgi:hypothetical protein